jgi:peroxiredoxin Q/BCP
MTSPSIGDKAPWPDGVTNQDGAAVRLPQFAGKHVLLYFYPKDDTPGCTIEACNFRDHIPEIPNTVILGASLDGPDSHKAFRAKHQLTFDLLVDKDRALAKAYGAVADGAATTGRSSVLIGPDGTVKAAWPKVDAKTHWLEVQKAVGLAARAS